MKKKLVLGGALVLLAALMAWGTWAYFVKDVHVTNVITTGTINITLNDHMEGATVSQDGSVATLTGVMPGVTVEKTVSVSNDDAETAGDAWIRVKVDTAVTGADGQPMDDTFTSGGAAEPVVQISFAGDGKWIQEKDASGAPTGYYYYATPLTRGEQTVDLFNAVTLNKLLPNPYQGCQVDIAVSAQAVQVKNNNRNSDGSIITELTAGTLSAVKGWPAEN